MTRAQLGRQVVANKLAWEDDRLASDAVLSAFRAQLASAVPMPNGPEMRNLWEPAKLGLKKLLRGRATPEEAATAASRRFHAIARRAPEKADARPYALLLGCALLALVTLAGRASWRALRGHRPADVLTGWSWVGPGMVTTTVLVFVPFAMGLGLAFFDHHEGSYTFVGFTNFADILLARRFPAAEPLSFYYALVVTLAWTVTNVALHVSIGLGLALLLNRADLAGKGIYRVLLVLPWAVPNYITALLWKGLFDWEFGTINGLLELLGLSRVAWFSSLGTAFVANLCTNAWLGFPFMMVVSLGALQAIPRELYEAADVDGASRWMTFRHVTLPLLRPALVPALLLGMVWTFNAFNVVYLVSGGEPDNATDILVSEAYRWAFARQEQYGYAAAYAALIFLILLGWSSYARKLARRAEESAR